MVLELPYLFCFEYYNLGATVLVFGCQQVHCFTFSLLMFKNQRFSLNLNVSSFEKMKILEIVGLYF